MDYIKLQTCVKLKSAGAREDLTSADFSRTRKLLRNTQVIIFTDYRIRCLIFFNDLNFKVIKFNVFNETVLTESCF